MINVCEKIADFFFKKNLLPQVESGKWTWFWGTHWITNKNLLWNHLLFCCSRLLLVTRKPEEWPAQYRLYTFSTIWRKWSAKRTVSGEVHVKTVRVIPNWKRGALWLGFSLKFYIWQENHLKGKDKRFSFLNGKVEN